MKMDPNRPMTKRQINAMETRRRLISAARVILATKPFEDVSIEDITKKAGVSTGTFYTYFKRKEDIVSELRSDDFFNIAEKVNGMDDKNIIERLICYGTEFLGSIEDAGIQVCRQWTKDNLSPTPMIGSDRITKYSFDYEAVYTVLSHSVEKGELSGDAPLDDLALFINSQFYGLMVAWCMSDGKVVGSKCVKDYCDTFVRRTLDPYMLK